MQVPEVVQRPVDLGLIRLRGGCLKQGQQVREIIQIQAAGRSPVSVGTLFQCLRRHFRSPFQGFRKISQKEEKQVPRLIRGYAGNLENLSKRLAEWMFGRPFGSWHRKGGVAGLGNPVRRRSVPGIIRMHGP